MREKFFFQKALSKALFPIFQYIRNIVVFFSLFFDIL